MSSTVSEDRRTVCIPQGLWVALELLARMNRTSVSEELRRAATARVERFGLAIVDEEVVLNPALWPVADAPRKSNKEEKSNEEEKSMAEEESNGEEKIHRGGVPRRRTKSMEEENGDA